VKGDERVVIMASTSCTRHVFDNIKEEKGMKRFFESHRLVLEYPLDGIPGCGTL
jgi:hypothetical protein